MDDEDTTKNGLFIPIQSGAKTDGEEEEESKIDEGRINAMDQYGYRYRWSGWWQ